MVGITLNMDWLQPLNSTDPSHIEASITKLQFSGGWFAHPIFVDGKYPEIMRQKVFLDFKFLLIIQDKVF